MRAASTRRREPTEARAERHYRLRGYRVLARNAWAAGYELDLVLRRGRVVVFCEVKSKGTLRFGEPLAMIGPEKARRVRRAAEAWLQGRPDLGGLTIRFDAVGVQGRRLVRVESAF